MGLDEQVKIMMAENGKVQESWILLANQLGFTRGDPTVGGIKYRLRNNDHLESFVTELLYEWEQQKTHEATLENLISALNRCKMSDVVAKLKKMATDTVDSAVSPMTSGPGNTAKIPKVTRKSKPEDKIHPPIHEDLTKELRKLTGFINPSKEEKKHHKDKVLGTVERLIQSLDKDASFYKLYTKRIEYVGSVYNNLRVGSADEFDYDVIIKFPMEHFMYSSSGERTSNEFCKLELKEMRSKEDYKWCLDSFEKAVDPDKIYNWFFNLIKKASANHDEIKKIEQKTPAVTLVIGLEDGKELDVDLAVAIEGYGLPHGADSNYQSEWPAYAALKKDLESSKNIARHPQVHRKSKWHFTCKPCSEDDSTDEDRHLYFRISTALLEKQFLDDMDSDKGCRKDVLRLLKQLRNTQEWSEIKSYALKSLIMQYAYKESESYWRMERMGDCFLDMLEYLKKSLKNPLGKQGIRSYFYPKRKLLEAIERRTADRLAKSVEKIIDELKINHEQIKKYIHRNQ